jgi:hypothetical protein
MIRRRSSIAILFLLMRLSLAETRDTSIEGDSNIHRSHRSSSRQQHATQLIRNSTRFSGSYTMDSAGSRSSKQLPKVYESAEAEAPGLL